MTRARSLDILRAALTAGAMLVGGPALASAVSVAATAMIPSA